MNDSGLFFCFVLFCFLLLKLENEGYNLKYFKIENISLENSNCYAVRKNLDLFFFLAKENF